MKEKILVFGGTGAMGMPLVRLLHESGYAVSVTSRRERNTDGVSYIRGSAQDIGFVSELMRGSWDAVIDFMSRSLDNQKQTLAAVLPKTGQYVFISSARVYAPSDAPLTEDSPRLLDVCTDSAYLATEEYALTKAREENLLYESGQINWTIVRPTLTYNTSRLQFALGEKEDWLYRTMNGQSIVFPADMAEVRTTMVHGDDAAAVIARLVCNAKALGQTVHAAVGGGGGTLRHGGKCLVYTAKCLKRAVSQYRRRVLLTGRLRQSALAITGR